MGVLQGRAKKHDGTAIDYVSIFNWSDGKCLGQASPDAAGNWSFKHYGNVNIGITYVADGCEPITHGSYQFTGWTPLTLFDDNQYGVWFDPSDLSTLYQDAEGTIPVTTDGQPVGLMLDKSGNNFHAKQVSSSKRPLYKTNGIHHWLLFDGSGAHMFVAHPIPTNIKNRAFFVGIRAEYFTKAASWVVSAYGGARSFLNLSLGIFPDTRHRLAAYYKNKRREITSYDIANSYGVVISTIYEEPDTVKILLDGVEAASNTASYSDVDFTANNGFVIGSADTLANDRFYVGNIYSMVFILKNLTADDIKLTSSYARYKMGTAKP